MRSIGCKQSVFVSCASETVSDLAQDYSVIIYQSLGMSGHMPLLMYALYVVVGASVNYIAAFCMDPLGRRPLFRKFVYLAFTKSLMRDSNGLHRNHGHHEHHDSNGSFIRRY